MASWNIPALINKIASDVPAINSLLKALLKWTTDGTTDVPTDAKRMASVTGGVQLQKYNGTSWGSTGKLMHDVDMVDGYHVATGQTANTIPVRNGNGVVPGNITGNAATATEASGLASDYTVPIAQGGTGATTAANARTNLGTNNAANITTGTLATARGGTGRTDGKVTDVHLTDLNVGALSLGQLGYAAVKNGSTVDCDTLVAPGHYSCENCTLEKHYPATGYLMLDVSAVATGVYQYARMSDNFYAFRRHSSNGGASWDAWLPVASRNYTEKYIYISKDGSDSNTGLSSTSPVLSWNRAWMVATGICAHTIVFCFGPGEWGGINFFGNTFQCQEIKITNYVNSNATTISAFEALTGTGGAGNQPPHFTAVNCRCGEFRLGNINADTLGLLECRCVSNATYKFSIMNVQNSFFTQNADFIVNKVDGNTGAVFNIYNSYFNIGNVSCKFLNSPTNSYFIYALAGSSIGIHGSFTSLGTFNGGRYNFVGVPSIKDSTLEPDLWPGASSGNFSRFVGSYPILGTTGMRLHHPEITKGTDPSASKWFTIAFMGYGTYNGNGSNRLGLVECNVNPEGKVSTCLAAYQNVGNTTNVATLEITYLKNGTKYATCPTPSDLTDSSNKIATTQWARTATGNTSLNAATATSAAQAAKLSTARKIFGQSFDGTGDVNGSVYTSSIEFSKVASNANHGGYIDFHFNGDTSDYTTRLIEDSKGLLTLGGMLHISSNGVAQLRLHNGSKCFFFRNDGGNLYLMKTADNDPIGSWDTTRPLIVNGATGICNINGNAATATKSNTADTPDANDNSTRTATTAWVRGRLGNGEFGMVPQGPWQWLSTNTLYTASSNGYVYARNSKYSSCGQQCKITVNAVEYWMQNTSYGSGSCNPDNVVIVPIKKGWAFRGNNLDVLGFLPA